MKAAQKMKVFFLVILLVAFVEGQVGYCPSQCFCFGQKAECSFDGESNEVPFGFSDILIRGDLNLIQREKMTTISQQSEETKFTLFDISCEGIKNCRFVLLIFQGLKIGSNSGK